jgi:hypothetical protein
MESSLKTNTFESDQQTMNLFESLLKYSNLPEDAIPGSESYLLQLIWKFVHGRVFIVTDTG